MVLYFSLDQRTQSPDRGDAAVALQELFSFPDCDYLAVQVSQPWQFACTFSLIVLEFAGKHSLSPIPRDEACYLSGSRHHFIEETASSMNCAYYTAVKMASENKLAEKKSEKNIPEIIQCVNANDINKVKDILLGGGAKVDDTDENGMTPLQHAAYKGQFEMCKLLLDYGANINADFHDHGYSPLHFAALSGNAQIVKLFLTAGAKTYHTNTLKRTAAQMAGFVGNHLIVALINNYLPLSDIQYYTKPQGLETEPKLSPEVAKPLYSLVMQTNLHPVYIAMSVEKSPVLMQHIPKASKVLSLMCEKEAKRKENVNEVICLKFHFLSYVLKTLDKELAKQQDKTDSKEGRLVFEPLIKKWLIGRPSDAFEEYLEYFVRDAIKAFPYVEMPLFLQVIRNISSKPGETWSVDILHGVINGQKGFDDGITCSTCGLDNKGVKKCAKCKSVQYCDKTCQRLHWANHKKFCEQFMKQYNKRLELEKEKEANEKGEADETKSEAKTDDDEKENVKNTEKEEKADEKENVKNAEKEEKANENEKLKNAGNDTPAN